MPVQYDKEQVVTSLQGKGELWYFISDNTVVIHNCNGEPIRERPFCTHEVLLELLSEGVIVKVRHNNDGFPYYPDEAQSDVYMLTT